MPAYRYLIDEAAVDALCDYIEHYGELTFPLSILPKSTYLALQTEKRGASSGGSA